MRVAAHIELTPADRQWLESRAWARRLRARLVGRCRIVLRAAAAEQDKTIAADMGSTRAKAARRRQRFPRLGTAGLERGAPRPGRTPAISPARKAAVVRRTTQETPAHATQWSTRSMAIAAELSLGSLLLAATLASGQTVTVALSTAGVKPAQVADIASARPATMLTTHKAHAAAPQPAPAAVRASASAPGSPPVSSHFSGAARTAVWASVWVFTIVVTAVIMHYRDTHGPPDPCNFAKTDPC